MSDDELLDRLGRTLEGGGRLAAPPHRVAEVRALVDARARAGRPVRRSVRHRVTVIAVGIAASLFLGVAIGHEMPRPVRHVADAIAPSWVDSPELIDARAVLDDLGRHLASQNTEGICAADTQMLDLVDRLDDDEKDGFVPVAHEVHVRAMTFLDGFSCPTAGD
jgi:hypothetical protein